ARVNLTRTTQRSLIGRPRGPGSAPELQRPPSRQALPDADRLLAEPTRPSGPRVRLPARWPGEGAILLDGLRFDLRARQGPGQRVRAELPLAGGHACRRT